MRLRPRDPSQVALGQSASPKRLKPIEGVSRRVVSLLAILALTAIVRLAATISVTRATAQGYGMLPVLRDNPWILWAEIAEAFIMLVCGIAFIFWLRRCLTNLLLLGVQTRYGRGWAIAGFILPFVPHIPIRMVQDVAWAAPSDDGVPRVPSSTIAIWWVTFLLSQNGPLVAGRLLEPTSSTLWRIEALGLAVSLGSLGLAIWIVRALTTGVSEIVDGRAAPRRERFGEAPTAVAPLHAARARAQVRGTALAAAVLLLSGAVAVAAPPASTTADARLVTGRGSTFTLTATKGDRIAVATQMRFGADDAFEVTFIGNSMFARIGDWRLDLVLPASTARFRPMSYSRVPGFDVIPDTGGHLDLSTLDRGCLRPTSTLSVDRVTYRGAVPSEMALRFTQTCASGGSLQGTMRWLGEPAPPPTRRAPAGAAFEVAYDNLTFRMEAAGTCDQLVWESARACLQRLGSRLALDVQRFVKEVRTIDLPPQGRATEARMVASARAFTTTLRRLATVDDGTIDGLAARLERQGKTVDERIQALAEAIAGDMGIAR